MSSEPASLSDRLKAIKARIKDGDFAAAHGGLAQLADPHHSFPIFFTSLPLSSNSHLISFYTCRCLLLDTYISSMFMFCAPLFSSLPLS